MDIEAEVKILEEDGRRIFYIEIPKRTPKEVISEMVESIKHVIKNKVENYNLNHWDITVFNRTNENVKDDQCIQIDDRKFIAKQESIDISMPMLNRWGVIMGRDSTLIIGDDCNVNCMEGSSITCGHRGNIIAGPNCYIKGGNACTVVRFDNNDIICLQPDITIRTNDVNESGYKLNVQEYCIKTRNLNHTLHKFSLYGEYATLEQLEDETD